MNLTKTNYEKDSATFELAKSFDQVTKILTQYMKWLTNNRMKIIGLEPLFDKVQNPISWINNWTSGSTSVQNAPQETEISSYVIGGTKQDVNEDTFKGFSL